LNKGKFIENGQQACVTYFWGRLPHNSGLDRQSAWPLTSKSSTIMQVLLKKDLGWIGKSQRIEDRTTEGSS
jgi:hypothetical protein